MNNHLLLQRYLAVRSELILNQPVHLRPAKGPASNRRAWSPRLGVSPRFKDWIESNIDLQMKCFYWHWVHTYTHETVLGSCCRLIDVRLTQLAVIIIFSLPIYLCATRHLSSTKRGGCHSMSSVTDHIWACTPFSFCIHSLSWTHGDLRRFSRKLILASGLHSLTHMLIKVF